MTESHHEQKWDEHDKAMHYESDPHHMSHDPAREWMHQFEAHEYSHHPKFHVAPKSTEEHHYLDETHRPYHVDEHHEYVEVPRYEHFEDDHSHDYEH